MRILVIRNEPPWPLCHGGRLHAYELCRRLAERHHLLLVAQRPGDARDRPFNFQCRVAHNNRLYDDPVDLVAEGFVASRWERFFGINMSFVRDAVRFVDEWQPDVVVGMNYQSLACLSRVRAVPRICDLLDDEMLYCIRELRAGCAKGKLTAMKCLIAAALYERQHIRQVDAVTVLSEVDRRCCARLTGHRRVLCIPHGVDCNHYHPREDAVDPNLISFWGGLSFGPNLSAVRYFAKRVWPRLRAQKPRLRWAIMGRGDSPRLEPVRRLPGIDLMGFVDDIRPVVARSAVTVVPMVSGAGIKNKIMEAWAMGKAVLCTPTALGDLPGVHGHNLWLAQTPRTLGDGLLRLLDDDVLRARLGRAGRQTALDHCSWQKAAEKLEELCFQVADRYAAATEDCTSSATATNARQRRARRAHADQFADISADH